MRVEEFIIKKVKGILPCFNSVAQDDNLPYSVFYIDKTPVYEKDGICKDVNEVEFYIVAVDYNSLQDLKNKVLNNLKSENNISVNISLVRDRSTDGSQWVSLINLKIVNYEIGNRI